MDDGAGLPSIIVLLYMYLIVHLCMSYYNDVHVRLMIPEALFAKFVVACMHYYLSLHCSICRKTIL